MSVLVLVDAKAKPEMGEELRAFFHGNQHGITASEGNEGVILHANLDDPDRLLLVEHWASREHYERYLAWRYQRGDHARMVSMLDGEVKVRVYEALG